MSRILWFITSIVVIGFVAAGIYISMTTIISSDASESNTSFSMTTVNGETISFTFAAELGNNVEVSEYAGDPIKDAVPGFSDAAYIQALFYGEEAPSGSLFDGTGGVRIYEASELAKYGFMSELVLAIDFLTTEKPDLKPYMVVSNEMSYTLPFLPIATHGQVLRARVQYVETESVRGLAYLSAVQAAVEPFNPNSFFYTFQGLSNGGKYYVSVVVPVETDLFPTELDSDFDLAKFADNLTTYLNKSRERLDAADASDFTPNLMSLDELVKSISFSS